MPEPTPVDSLSSFEPSRRAFLGWLAAVVPAAWALPPTVPSSGSLEKLDDALLLSLATAILPTEIGADGARRWADALQKWIAAYRVDAELNHPYGSARLRTTGPDPSTRWALQLRTLDMDARRAHGSGFGAVRADQRRVLIRSQLAEEHATALPGDMGVASHVALALLGLFYASPEATDLCYEAAIARTACRPLAQAAQRPVPLRRGGARP